MEAQSVRDLDVYQCALEFAGIVHSMLTPTPRGHSDLADQLRRASDSIVLNIAEGAGEFSPKEKARHDRIARRSATECVGALDLFGASKVLTEDQLQASRALLDRILAMLTKLVYRHSDHQP
ncbi:MAG: four helix bundle protein [bacterium]|nr:four helix bundle protein [bacterium]